MSSPMEHAPGHPVTVFAQRLHARLDELAETPLWSMTPASQRDALVALARAEARLAELRLRVLAQGERDDIAADSAATSTAAWVAHATRQERGAAVRDVELAVALEADFGSTRQALAAGHVDREQARVIVAALRRLERDVPTVLEADPTVLERAEKQLLVDADTHDARALAALGRRVLEVLDPDVADAELGKRLEADERAAARSTYFEMFHNPDGSVSGRHRFPVHIAAMLGIALDALASPSRRRATAAGDHRSERTAEQTAPAAHESAHGRTPRLTRPELLGQAFCELVERLDPATLPRHGGRNATVVVMLDYDRLLSGIGTATLDSGHQISASLARRLACESGIVPAVYRTVLGGRSQVLDLGHEQRFYTSVQRLALIVRDRVCTTDACDRPAGVCHAHHDVPWSQGGRTDLDTGRLLCAFHHGKSHSPAYDMQRLPSGQVRFHRRT